VLRMKENIVLKQSRINEHNSWIIFCNLLKEKLGLSKDEFNKSKAVREIIIAVERWGYFEAIRRRDENKFKKDGIFWNGDEE
jgi:hypothetical protein